MNNLISPNSYIKKIPVELMSYSCVFKDVETKQIRKLNFYEKAIVLLLSKGVKADTIESLIEKISKFLNIRESFVSEFIYLLDELESLHDGGNIFSLSQSVKFEKYNKDERILVSNVKSGTDNFEYLYISQLDVVAPPSVPGLKIDQSGAMLITENYISPLANLISPHLKKLEAIAQDTLPNDLAMFFDKDYLLNQLNNTESYGKKALFYADVEYVYDEDKKQGTIASVVELLNNSSEDKWAYFNESLTNYIMNTYVVDYDEPLFVKAKSAVNTVEMNQRVLINHKKDFISNEKSISKLEEKISTLNFELEESKKQIKEMEKNISQLKKSDDEKALSKEELAYEKKLNEIAKKKELKDKMFEDKKQIETENIIIGHKIEDASKSIIKTFKSSEFSSSKPYFNKIDELYQIVMKLPCIELRTSIDNMVKAVLTLLQQIEDRCEEGIKAHLQVVRSFTDIINLIFEYVYKVEDKNATHMLYDSTNKIKNFDKFKKVCPKYTPTIQNNLVKLLPLLNAVKHKNDKDKPWLEEIKKEAIKDFFETNRNNKTYRKDIIFAFVDFVLCLDFQEKDWIAIEEKLK